MTDDDIRTYTFDKKDRANLLLALKALAGAEVGKLPTEFSPDRLADYHDLTNRLSAEV